MAKTPRLTTIGYEGASLTAFISTLKASGVTLLLDVRELPVTRRKGFSKTPLCRRLRVPESAIGTSGRSALPKLCATGFAPTEISSAISPTLASISALNPCCWIRLPNPSQGVLHSFASNEIRGVPSLSRRCGARQTS